MSAEIRQLENEAAAARAKLAADLAVLRTPATYSEFKDGLKREAMDAKDAVIETVRDNVRTTAENWVDDIKARAAANPGAALLIGAGVAWHVLKNPPITTALVGAGLLGLWRASPDQSDRHLDDNVYLDRAKHRLQEQASEIALEAKNRTAEFVGIAKHHAADLADTTRESASSMMESARQKIQAVSDTAKLGTQNLLTQSEAKSEALIEGVKERSEATADYVKSAARNGAGAVVDSARAVVPDNNRDRFLLGAAGVAVTAALTLALQRRMSGRT